MVLMNLFVVFDPCSYYGYSLNWLILGCIIMFFPLNFYVVGSKSVEGFKTWLMGAGGMFMEISGANGLGIVYLVVSLFMFLVLSNVLGLFPYIFTSTSHPMITMSVGLVMWVSFFMMGWGKNMSFSAAHLVPEGSPLFLSPVMVIIESISHLIRPFTLSIRLAANMMAGHLIVSLLSGLSSHGCFGALTSLLFQILLFLLEVGVCIIQGFVFSILLLLYAMEYY